ncbi:hypothetical protein DL89DRAFT_259955 [Linderina pennispora]|uniref:Uncharacterized protein n=1 Tax=Linderina pennispora TaxID=61395 RepID=A0A1Y1W0L9_9FUNG|nr:uncharacterized protein DL89DRAFT_259955 [Linderina pennispora]ORX66845.1 hypothetical protein DL89DRAFT_259955 [Linderina pennispora]
MPDPGRILPILSPGLVCSLKRRKLSDLPMRRSRRMEHDHAPGASWPVPETADTQPASSILEQPDIGTGDSAKETVLEAIQQLPGIRKASVVDGYVPVVQKDISLLGLPIEVGIFQKQMYSQHMCILLHSRRHVYWLSKKAGDVRYRS